MSWAFIAQIGHQSQVERLASEQKEQQRQQVQLQMENEQKEREQERQYQIEKMTKQKIHFQSVQEIATVFKDNETHIHKIIDIMDVIKHIKGVFDTTNLPSLPLEIWTKILKMTAVEVDIYQVKRNDQKIRKLIQENSVIGSSLCGIPYGVWRLYKKCPNFCGHSFGDCLSTVADIPITRITTTLAISNFVQNFREKISWLETAELECDNTSIKDTVDFRKQYTPIIVYGLDSFVCGLDSSAYMFYCTVTTVSMVRVYCEHNTSVVRGYAFVQKRLRKKMLYTHFNI